MSVGAVNKNTGERIPTAGMPAIDNALSLNSTNPVQNAIITAALAGKQNTLTIDSVPTDGSTNPVESNGVYDALATKQDATDNSLDTTAKTIVGAINEHEGDISSLMSGLTNYQTQNDLNLEVPDRKNVLPITLTMLKILNTNGTWSNNVYTYNDVTFTVTTNADNYVTEITVNGTASETISFTIKDTFAIANGAYILNGCPSGGGNESYQIDFFSLQAADIGNGYAFTVSTGSTDNLRIRIASGYAVSNVTFCPMIRPATITDPTFAPYIPSVESRIEAVESGLTNVPKFAKVNVTIPSTVNSLSNLVPLPNGFTKSNCAIVNAYCDPNVSDRYFMATLQAEGVQIFFTNDNVQINTLSTAVSGWLGKTVIVILQTIPS